MVLRFLEITPSSGVLRGGGNGRGLSRGLLKDLLKLGVGVLPVEVVAVCVAAAAVVALRLVVGARGAGHMVRH